MRLNAVNKPLRKMSSIKMDRISDFPREFQIQSTFDANVLVAFLVSVLLLCPPICLQGAMFSQRWERTAMQSV
jgi:hypothetical protein